MGDQNKWELNLALNKSITRLLCGESFGSGSVWIAWQKGEVGVHMDIPQLWSKNWHEAFGGNRLADSNSNAVQDKLLFLGKVVETVVKCQRVSTGRLIL